MAAFLASYFDIILCASCLVFAAHSPAEQRGPAVVMASVFVAMWQLYLLSWSDLSPASLFWSVDIMVEPTDLWALQDAVVGLVAVVIATTYRLAWAWVLWAIIIATEVGHSAYSFKLWSYPAYSMYLAGTFWASVACFASIGGRNVGRRIHYSLGRRSLRVRPAQTA